MFFIFINDFYFDKDDACYRHSALDINIIHVHFKQKIKDSEVSFCIYLKFIQFSQEVKIYLILKRIYFFGISEMTL